MRFVLPAGVVEDPRGWDDLDRLRLRVIEEVHLLHLPDADELERTEWFLGLRPHQREHLRQIVLAGSYRSPPAAGAVHARSLIIDVDLDLRSAVRLAHEPLLVLVENVNTDGILVEAAVEAHGSPELKRLWSLETSTGRPVRLHSRGGTGELLKEVRALCGAAGANGLPVRLVVMTESDKRWAAEAPPKSAEIAGECLLLGVPCLVLSCRCIENYIPDAAFDAWVADIALTNMRPAVSALKRLTSEQRDHFPMKGKNRGSKGFAAIDKADAPADQRALFASVPQADRAALEKGFTDDIIHRIDGAAHRTAQALDSRDVRGDLRRLVTMIAEAL